MFDFGEFRFTRQFEEAYSELPESTQNQCDRALRFLSENPDHNSLNLEPIHPSKIYWEARLNRGDRLIFRPEGPVAYIVDVVRHDDIGRYGGR